MPSACLRSGSTANQLAESLSMHMHVAGFGESLGTETLAGVVNQRGEGDLHVEFFAGLPVAQHDFPRRANHCLDMVTGKLVLVRFPARGEGHGVIDLPGRYGNATGWQLKSSGLTASTTSTGHLPEL